MNFRYVAKLLGMLTVFISLSMLFSVTWSIKDQDWEMVRAFVYSITIGLGIGAAFFFYGRKTKQEFFRREGLAVVSLGWILCAAVAALPFYFCDDFAKDAGGYVSAYFEAMSGITTTGSTVITGIENMPRGLLFWRSFTQWLGGMGIVVLFVAILPALGVEAKHLYKVEVPGINKEGATPRIKDAASLLWKIYFGFTVLETVLLMVAGMSFFDALNHTFTTLATGGFSTRNASVAAFDSIYIEIVIIIFMVMVGINFSLYISALRGRWDHIIKDVELKTYFLLTIVLTVLVAVSLQSGGIHSSVLQSVRESIFQVVSIMTTTGFCTADFELWTPFCRLTFVALMFVGGCAGSTGGSMKVIRVMVVVKAAALEVERFFHPKMVKQLKIGKNSLPDATLHAVMGFTLLFITCWVVGSIFMTWLGLDIVSASTSVIACLGNIGPGLAKVGAVENFGWIPASGKILLSFCMVAGRLELFTVMVLFIPAFWRE